VLAPARRDVGAVFKLQGSVPEHFQLVYKRAFILLKAIKHYEYSPAKDLSQWVQTESEMLLD